MTLRKVWLRARLARLLQSAKERVAAGAYQAARDDVDRLFNLYDADGESVPAIGDIMRALVAWNLGDYQTTARSVRSAGDKIAGRLADEKHSARRNELNYLRAYCWTLLYYAEEYGWRVDWDDFADIVVASHVSPNSVNRTLRQMFPVDEQVFAPAQG